MVLALCQRLRPGQHSVRTAAFLQSSAPVCLHSFSSSTLAERPLPALDKPRTVKQGQHRGTYASSCNHCSEYM